MWVSENMKFGKHSFRAEIPNFISPKPLYSYMEKQDALLSKVNFMFFFSSMKSQNIKPKHNFSYQKTIVETFHYVCLFK